MMCNGSEWWHISYASDYSQAKTLHSKVNILAQILALFLLLYSSHQHIAVLLLRHHVQEQACGNVYVKLKVRDNTFIVISNHNCSTECFKTQLSWLAVMISLRNSEL